MKILLDTSRYEHLTFRSCVSIVISDQVSRDLSRASTGVFIFQDTVYPIDLRETDLPVVDSDGYTLIMLAAKHDK